MISDNNFRRATEIISNLEHAGLTGKFRAKHGTPLAELMATTIDMQGSYIGDRRDTVGNAPHEALIKSASEMIRNTVEGSLYRARSVVLPIVKELMTDAEEHCGEPINGIDMEVVEFEVPEVFNRYGFEELLAGSLSSAEKAPKIDKWMLPTFSEEQLTMLGKTGISMVDETMGLLNSTDSMRRANAINFIAKYVPVSPGFNEEDILVRLYAFLLCISIVHHAEDLGVEMPYVLHVKHMRGKLATDLTRIINNLRRAINSGRMFVSLSTSKAVVFKESYQAFLKAGGTIEAVIGGAIKNAIMLRKDDLLANAGDYCKVYSGTVAARTAAITSRRLQMYRAKVHKDLREIIKTDERFADIKDQALVNLEERLKTLEIMKGMTYNFVLDLVCNSLYPQADTFRLICEVDSICAADETIKPKEAAGVVAVNMAIKWWLLQVERV